MSHLLSCWDIHMEGVDRRLECAKDIRVLQKIMTAKNWDTFPASPVNALVWEDRIIVITDCTLTIIHATKNIFAMNGYRQDEVIGKSPKMFQGKKTESTERRLIKTAVKNQQPFETLITNYKKDGSMYTCHIEGHPVFNKTGNLVNFIAFEDAP